MFLSIVCLFLLFFIAVYLFLFAPYLQCIWDVHVAFSFFSMVALPDRIKTALFVHTYWINMSSLIIILSLL